jgi:hypothetical protein
MPVGAGSDNATFYRTELSDQDGRFIMSGVRPGEYDVIAWEEIAPYAWMDPDFRSRYQTRGERISVEALGRDTLDLEVIPSG